MLVSYPALFYFDDSESVPYFVHFPDFEHSATQGETIPEALHMASDWLGLVLTDYIEHNKDIPPASAINDLSLEKNDPFRFDDDFQINYDQAKSFISMVNVDLSAYIDDNELVKKTLSIPKWADKLGKDLNLNFSKTLTEAIVEKKIS